MIHETAIVSSKAKISKNVEIGAYSIIGPNVEIGDHSTVQPNVSIIGNTKIGKNNKIYSFASIGNDPQDLKYKNEKTKIIIGDNNKIREYVTINPGTLGGGGVTKIGDNCLFMVHSHIAHDCLIGNNVILANSVPIGGHAQIEDDVIIGGNSAVQQFTRVGKLSMIGGMCGVVKDVLPYSLVYGNRSILQGVNIIGLRRKNISNEKIKKLKETFDFIFKNEYYMENLKNLPEKLFNDEIVKDIVNFLNNDKKRPICTPLRIDEND
tara:strand:+ start:2600 stop:3394 length:795 start_codon:yes stop_codon:yes gene_type:complete